MKQIIQVRIWNPERNRFEYSGGTPTMMAAFYRRTAKLFTFHEQEYEYSTGRKDKNGLEMYGRDVVDINARVNRTLKQRAIIIFYASAWQVDMGPFYPKAKEGWMEGLNGILHTEIEVIGNCHQNPELLEGK